MDIDTISPREFEELVAKVFEHEGYSVALSQQTRDGGIDVIAERVNSLGLPDEWIIECKKYSSNPIGVDVIRQLAGVRELVRARNAAVVCSTRFTKDAALTAEQLNISLVDGSDVQNWAAKLETEKHTQSSAEPPKRFQSVFISHSHQDHEFVSRLNLALRQQGVKTWFSHSDLNVGEKIHEALFSAIDSFDRLIIVLSEASISSPWVTTELRRAIARETNEGAPVLFPISLLPFERLSNWVCFDSDTGTDIAAEIRQYLIPQISSNPSDEEFSDLVKKLTKSLGGSNGT